MYIVYKISGYSKFKQIYYLDLTRYRFLYFKQNIYLIYNEYKDIFYNFFWIITVKNHILTSSRPILYIYIHISYSVIDRARLLRLTAVNASRGWWGKTVTKTFDNNLFIIIVLVNYNVEHRTGVYRRRAMECQTPLSFLLSNVCL